MNSSESNDTKVLRMVHQKLSNGTIPKEPVPLTSDSPEIFRRRLAKYFLTNHRFNITPFLYDKEAKNNGLYERLEALKDGFAIPYEHKTDETILKSAQGSSYVLLQGYKTGYECRIIETKIIRCFVLDAKTFKAMRDLSTTDLHTCWNNIQKLMAALDKKKISVDDKSVKFASASASDSPNSALDFDTRAESPSPKRTPSKKRKGDTVREQLTMSTPDSKTMSSNISSSSSSASGPSNSKKMQARDIFMDVSTLNYEQFKDFMDSTTRRDKTTLGKILQAIEELTSMQTMPFHSSNDDKNNNAFKTGRELSEQRNLNKTAEAFEACDYDHAAMNMTSECKEYLENQDELTKWTINEYQYQLSILNQILSIYIKEGGFSIINYSTTHEKYPLEFDFGIPVNAITLMTYLDTRLGTMSTYEKRVNIVERIMKLRIQIIEDLSSDVMYEAADEILQLAKELHLCTDGKGNLSNEEVTTLISGMTSQILSKHSIQLQGLKKQLQSITIESYKTLCKNSPYSGEIKYGMISMVISLFGTIADERKAEETKCKVHNGPAVASGNSTKTHIALLNISSISPGPTLINSSVTVPLQEQVPFCLWQFCATCAKESKEFHLNVCKFRKCKHDHDEVKIQAAMKSNDPRLTCGSCGVMGCPSIIGDKMTCQKEFNKDSKHKGGKYGKRKNNRNNNRDRDSKKRRDNDHNLQVTLNQALDVINNYQKDGSAASQNGANPSQASSSSTPTVAAATTTGSNLSSSSSSTPTVASGATTDAEKKSEMTKRLQSALLARVKTVQENKKQKSRKARFGSRTKSRN